MHLFHLLKKSDYETKIFYITEKVENKFFFEILIIFKNLSKYIKNDFFSEKK